MSWERLRRRAPPEPAGPRGEAVQSQLAWAAGAESFQHRDPLYHVTEDFHQTFDALGRRHAAQLASGGEGESEDALPEGLDPQSDSARAFYECASPEDQALLHRFSETAFQRGTLSGAVLQGTGQMMLFSCLKKTVGQSQPDKWQQRKLFQKASAQKGVPGHRGERVAFNRGFSDSAVALTVDTLRDARRVVDSLADLAAGKSPMGPGGGAETLRKMYPFLDDSRERALLEDYRRQLEALPEDNPERPVLQNAVVRAQALADKKAQMKQEFVNKLRFFSDRAREAQELFEAPGFTAALAEALAPGPEEDGDGTAAGTGAPPAGGGPPEDGGDPETGAASGGGPGGPSHSGGHPPGGAAGAGPGGTGGLGGEQRHAEPGRPDAAGAGEDGVPPASGGPGHGAHGGA